MSVEKTHISVPVLLLKTKSTPADGYEEHFNALDDGIYQPIFIPVLEHQFKKTVLKEVQQLIETNAFSTSPSPKYGGLIFTSQRAVEAFAEIVQAIRTSSTVDLDTLLPSSLPLYVVGPATERGLKSLNLHCPILGQETGNGDALAQFILDDYSKRFPQPAKPALLFLVGEKRRDIIPKTLSTASMTVTELVIYETGEMASFRSEFTSVWQTHRERGVTTQWVVVFSPTGCRAMLESLGLIDADLGKANPLSLMSSAEKKQNMYIATIGPTTRDYLRAEFSLEPDVCAETPSPEGVGAAIAAFMTRL
ncbi:uroporphyrinogen-III synthase [Pseudovirgaria hyperparasitica]|uniref:Uroporphyrinogen-III synthase n=1 Tax=Pseudovirgaria hyperparasitica TaxID=470096 RepID=A0A6A6VST0_9PEZI|nr:uroporphyrinogen-III synthase [Pseudovirgaria hyperparasitica]KAF2753728.1 uroporphyrinogen-III synthase [Pseudovirgaria hyperparasitica]